MVYATYNTDVHQTYFGTFSLILRNKYVSFKNQLIRREYKGCFRLLLMNIVHSRPRAVYLPVNSMNHDLAAVATV